VHAGAVTVAGTAPLSYKSTPTVIIDKIDRRSESLMRPIARYKYTMVLPTGGTSISTKLDQVNGEIKQVTFKTPALGSKTGTVYAYDELGAELWNSGAKAQSSTHTLISAATYAILSGISTLTVTVSGAQASPVTFTVILYVR
jgi:hypothetical protein